MYQGGPFRVSYCSSVMTSPAVGHFGVFRTLHLVSQTLTRHHQVCLCSVGRPKTPWVLLLDCYSLCSHCRDHGVPSLWISTSKRATTTLVMVDILTKMTILIPCLGLPMAQSTAQLLMPNMFEPQYSSAKSTASIQIKHIER